MRLQRIARRQPGRRDVWLLAASVVSGDQYGNSKKNDKHKEYALYAEHSLAMAKIATDQKSRIIQREMAAEWLKLADAVALQSLE